MEKKEIKFRGKTIEELKALEVREFATHLKSKQRRILLRNFQEIEKFVGRMKNKISKNKNIKTHLRDMIIVPDMVGMKVQVYNGNSYVAFEIVTEMLGHKLGEFSPTRKRIQHGSAGVGATKGSKHKSKK